MSRCQLSTQRYVEALESATTSLTDPLIGGPGACNLKSNYEAVPGKEPSAKNYVAAVPIGGPRGQATASSAAASTGAASSGAASSRAASSGAASSGAASSAAASSAAASSAAASSGAAKSGAASSGAASSTGGM